MLNEWKATYIRQQAEAAAKRAEIEGKKQKKREQIRKLEAQIRKLDDDYFTSYRPSWINALVEPLAAELAAKLNLAYEIYGPFGLRHQTTIYFIKDAEVSIIDQSTKSLTLVPGNLDEAELLYETGRLKEGFTSSTHANDTNGFRKELKTLPDDISEILSIIEEQQRTLEERT